MTISSNRQNQTLNSKLVNSQDLTVHSTCHRQGLEREQTLSQLSDQCQLKGTTAHSVAKALEKEPLSHTAYEKQSMSTHKPTKALTFDPEFSFLRINLKDTRLIYYYVIKM